MRRYPPLYWVYVRGLGERKAREYSRVDTLEEALDTVTGMAVSLPENTFIYINSVALNRRLFFIVNDSGEAVRSRRFPRLEEDPDAMAKRETAMAEREARWEKKETLWKELDSLTGSEDVRVSFGHGGIPTMRKALKGLESGKEVEVPVSFFGHRRKIKTDLPKAKVIVERAKEFTERYEPPSFALLDPREELEARQLRDEDFLEARSLGDIENLPNERVRRLWESHHARQAKEREEYQNALRQAFPEIDELETE